MIAKWCFGSFAFTRVGVYYLVFQNGLVSKNVRRSVLAVA